MYVFRTAFSFQSATLIRKNIYPYAVRTVGYNCFAIVRDISYSVLYYKQIFPIYFWAGGIKKECMNEAFERTELIFGKEAMQKLNNSSVAVFGLGGVGGYCVEALARCGVGKFTLVDNDVFVPSNLNRQILATFSTLGKKKTEVAKERVLDINPNATVLTKDVFFLPENEHEFDFSSFDYVVDAIDTVSAKIALAKICFDKNVPIISCMGTGNKTDPSLFEITDVYKTSVCPLAKVMRRELKKIGVERLKVLYSKEEPLKITVKTADTTKRATVASLSFVPSVAGLMIGGEVIKDLIKG